MNKINLKEKKLYKIIIKNTIFVTIILVLFFSLTYFINKNISISLIGNKAETIEVFSEHPDPGYTAIRIY